MPSGSAYRPSDVLTIYGGKTVENGNSDAEGRLVMADALARANEDHPDLVIDVATPRRPAWSRSVSHGWSDGNRRRHSRPGSRCGRDCWRGVWQLPIPKEIRGKLDSKVADIRSVGHDRWGGALVAAAFLREFVADGTPGLTSTLPDQRSSTASRATSPQEGPGLASARSSRSLAHSRLDWPAVSADISRFIN